MKMLRYTFLSVCFFLSGLAWAADPDANTTVNINTADVQTLSAALKGVGVSKAKAIIAYRESYGAFKAVEELRVLVMLWLQRTGISSF